MTDWPDGGTGQMFSLIHELPAQLAASADLEGLDTMGALPAGFKRVLLCGMGGSAIAGDLVQTLLQHQDISLDVWRDYGLPHWVDAGCLVIVASYSGNTEESLSALVEARRRGSSVIGITSGGQLLAAAAGEGGQAFPAVILPGGLPPRASLGYGLGALVRVLGHLGMVQDAEGEIGAAVRVLEEMDAERLHPFGQSSDEARSEDQAGMISARALAKKLTGAIPVIYTAGIEAQGAGVRLKGQINENSKCPACLGVFPELNHNDLVGWELPDHFQGRFVLLVMGGKLDNERMVARIRKTKELLATDFPEIHEIHPSGNSGLARVLSMVQYGDYLSCHLAQLKDIDPVPVTRIGKLKDFLAKL